MTRSELREKAMITLYQTTIFSEKELEFSVDDFILENVLAPNQFVKDIVEGVITNKELLNETANKFMKDWDISRIDKPGAEILRIAFYELMYTDTPKIVVIDEAVELAKKYSDDSVRKIINAALDKYVREING